MAKCSFPGAPPPEAEYAEPPPEVEPGFFSCSHCKWARPGGDRGGVCIYPVWTVEPPFNVSLAGCCRFQASNDWACGRGPGAKTWV